MPGFRAYATATLISEAGTAVSWIVLPIVVYQLTNSPVWTAAVAVANAAPYLTLGLFAGAIADQRARIVLMVGANLISGLALASIPITFRLGNLTALQVVLAAVISQSAFVFYDAANFGFLMSLVGRDRILAANGLLYSYVSVLEALAPAVVGLSLSHLSVPYLVLFDAASFLISSFLLQRMAGISLPTREVSPSQRLTTVVAEGVRYFRQNKTVGRTTLISALMTAANGGVISVLIVWITHSFHLETHDARIGGFYFAIAASGIAAGKIAEFAGRKWTPDTAMKGLVPMSAALGYAMLLAPAWWLAAILLGVSTGLGTASVVVAVSARQQAIPERLQSRVNTLGRMIAFGLGFSVGAVIAGGLGAAVPIEAALAVVLLMRVAATVVAYLPQVSPVAQPQIAMGLSD